MTQRPQRTCPNCHSPLTAEQRFCSNCGTVVDVASNNPTQYTPDYSASNPRDMATQMPVPTPPPPSYQPSSSTPPYQGYQAPSQGYQPQMVQPDYSVPQKDSSRSVLRQIGCGMGLVILVVLLLCGAGGYFAYNYVRGLSHSVPGTTSTGSSVTNSDASPTAAPITTLAMKPSQSLDYAGVKLTLVDVKQSANFLDDSSISKPGVVRLDFKEDNPSTRAANYAYSDAMRLILPDNSSVTPLNALVGVGPDASTTRTNWVDFQVPGSIKPNQLTLQLAKSSEAQMNVPLTGDADLSKYQTKTVTPNRSVLYAGLNWTVTKASLQYSIAGSQADSGMTYVLVTLKLDNTSTNDFNAYYGDYIRLKAGATTAAPTSDSTIPLSVAAGQTNASGVCIFKVPQGNNDFTLLLLATPSMTGSQQESIPFQIR